MIEKKRKIFFLPPTFHFKELEDLICMKDIRNTCFTFHKFFFLFIKFCGIENNVNPAKIIRILESMGGKKVKIKTLIEFSFG